MDAIEKGVTRRHTFFCTSTERHIHNPGKVVKMEPYQIVVFGRTIDGWLVTTEESVISKVIPLDESLRGDVVMHDPE
ncbi:MAG: hypothetical protein IT369_00975 [Candidatus Latescibacteria bacterium]|nr:hypothetical protein [Candidatus Latescibacterota bacterium]